MSETEHYTGKLTRVPQYLGNGPEEQAKNILAEKGICEKDDWNDTWVDQLMDDCCDEYIKYEDALYSVKRSGNNADDDIFEAEKDNDGVISFTVKYYNGGCGFGEAIGYALEKLGKGVQ